MNFFKKPSLEEQMSQNERETKRVVRRLERDQNELDREEKRLMMEIKKLAKTGNKEACRVMAKQLVQLRQQRAQSCSLGAKIGSVNTQQRLMHSNMRLGAAMKNSTEVMTRMNKQTDPQKTMEIVKQFEMANAKSEMTEDMMNDTLSGLFDTDEAAEDSVVQRVLDEIGVEISGKMADAPAAHQGVLGAKSEQMKSEALDAHLESQLAKLRSL